MEQSLEKSQEITRMLQEWSGGKQEALDVLLPLVYAEAAQHNNRQDKCDLFYLFHSSSLLNLVNLCERLDIFIFD